MALCTRFTPTSPQDVGGVQITSPEAGFATMRRRYQLQVPESSLASTLSGAFAKGSNHSAHSNMHVVDWNPRQLAGNLWGDWRLIPRSIRNTAGQAGDAGLFGDPLRELRGTRPAHLSDADGRFRACCGRDLPLRRHHGSDPASVRISVRAAFGSSVPRFANLHLGGPCRPHLPLPEWVDSREPLHRPDRRYHGLFRPG
mgnify:CR=1 FL=1